MTTIKEHHQKIQTYSTAFISEDTFCPVESASNSLRKAELKRAELLIVFSPHSIK